jgi:hypothetical protein
MRHFLRGCGFVAAAFIATQAQAQSQAQGQTRAQQPAADPEPEEVIVQGSADRDRQISDFVGALTPARVGGQLSRFDFAVCPATVGMTPTSNAAVTARLRRVAQGAEIPVAEPGCRPNVLVLVTRNKRELIERMARQYPAYFTDIPDYRVRQLARSPGPVAAWHVEGLLSADGIEVPRDQLTGQRVLESTNIGASRLSVPSRPHFMAAIVVVELNALAGLTTTQLADYAAMRAFARTEPQRLSGSTAPTILSVLEAPMGSEVPITLTQWDLSFLRALYSSSQNLLANQERGELRDRLRRDLESSREREAN